MKEKLRNQSIKDEIKEVGVQVQKTGKKESVGGGLLFSNGWSKELVS